MRRFFRRTHRLVRWGGLAVVAVVAVSLVAPAKASAQDPPDSVVVQLPDSLVPGVTVVALDSGTVVDTLYTTHPDSVFRALPALTAGAPGRPEAGVTVWDRDALLGTPALTLLELLAREPDLTALRYGDYGSPEAVLGPGMAGGRIRVIVDGFEEAPLDGAVTDLSRIGLMGVREVRVERGGGELRISLTSLDPDDSRPLSLVEAGTGDLNTNLFRGTFLHPRALGGTLGLSLERKDSEGRGGAEPGSRQAIWFRYAAHKGDDVSLSFDMRKSTTESLLDSIPPSIDRTSWAVRGRARLTPSLVAELYTGSTSLRGDADELTSIDGDRSQHGARLSWDRGFGAARVDTTPSRPPAAVMAPELAPDTIAEPSDTLPPVPDTIPPPPDTLPPAPDTLPPAPDSAAPAPVPTTPLAVDPGGLSGRLWGRAEGRLFSGDELPSRRISFEAGADVLGVGGLAFELGSDAWADPVRSTTASVRGLRAWTDPIFGISLFGGWDQGVRGAHIEGRRLAIPVVDTLAADTIPVAPDTLPRFYLSDRTSMRVGARVSVGPLDLMGAWHRVDVDSVLPLGILGARDGASAPGDEVTGFEVSGRVEVPVQFEGLSLVGSLLQWESEGLYRPGRTYTGGLDFHNVYKTGNLEFWASLLVEGRDSMLVPQLVGSGEDLSYLRTPFYQSWNLWLQVRVLTVRIFIRTENVTLRGENQDFVGRFLPQTRSVYGVRWTLWN